MTLVDSSNKKVRGNSALTLAIQEVELTAKKDGLTPKIINQLLDVAASAKFRKYTLNTIIQRIKNMHQ